MGRLLQPRKRGNRFGVRPAEMRVTKDANGGRASVHPTLKSNLRGKLDEKKNNHCDEKAFDKSTL